MQRRLLAIIGCTWAISMVGCGARGPETYAIKGTVNFDGKPIPKGDIVLLPVDPSVAPDAGKIIDGMFEFRARAGAKRVEIQANKVGKPDPVMKSPNMVSYIPARYNVESELTLEVSPHENHFDFNLKSNVATQ